MIDKDFETPLYANWLNSREKFDLKARNLAILNEFLYDISGKTQLLIADFGCGTGSNALFLTETIETDSTWHLVERETELIKQAKKRVKKRFKNLVKENDDLFHVNFKGRRISFHFHNKTIEYFIKSKIDVNVITASALFDLFTKKEFEILFQWLVKKKISLYSVINYTGITFYPSSTADKLYISYFELHMSRNLAKGRPMGKNTMKMIKAISENEPSSCISIGDSKWEVSPEEKDFLYKNFYFYNDAILECINNTTKVEDFKNWIKKKHIQIKEATLSLTVKHQDFLIKHKSS